MWNAIRKTKKSNENTDAISLDTLVDHFKQKFSICDSTEFINLTKQDVEQKFQNICNNNTEYHDYVISENKIRNYIKKLKHRSAPGLDGITAEHLLLALDSTLPLHISNMLSLCLKYGILPDMFCKGLLIPILKKIQFGSFFCQKLQTYSCLSGIFKDSGAFFAGSVSKLYCQ